jgi:hypothetical protein
VHLGAADAPSRFAPKTTVNKLYRAAQAEPSVRRDEAMREIRGKRLQNCSLYVLLNFRS